MSLTPSSGDASTPVVVTYDANGTFETREVVITITTTGTTGVPITDDFSISQAGSQGIEVVTDPVNLSALSKAEGAINVDVTLLGSARGWSASEAGSNPAGFLILGGTSGIAGDDVLIINYSENTGADLRNASVTLTATGGTGTAHKAVIRISQLGTGPNVVIDAPAGGRFSCTSCGRGYDCSGCDAYGRCFGLDCGGWGCESG